MNVEYYGDLDDPEGLVPAERDPVTGRRVPARRSKRQDQPQVAKAAAKRSPWVVAAVVVVVVLLLAGGAVAVTSKGGSNDDSATATTRSGGAGAGGTTAPGGGGASSTVPAPPQEILYTGGRVVEQVNITPFSDPAIVFSCREDTCTPALDDVKGSAATGWTSEQVTDMGEICISNGVAKGRETTTYRWDLKGEGTTTIDGHELPARVTGTYSIITPGVPDCLEESRYVYEFDATPVGD